MPTTSSPLAGSCVRGSSPKRRRAESGDKVTRSCTLQRKIKEIAKIVLKDFRITPETRGSHKVLRCFDCGRLHIEEHRAERLCFLCLALNLVTRAREAGIASPACSGEIFFDTLQHALCIF